MVYHFITGILLENLPHITGCWRLLDSFFTLALIAEEFFPPDNAAFVGVCTASQAMLQGVCEEAVGHLRGLYRLLVTAAREEEHHVTVLMGTAIWGR